MSSHGWGRRFDALPRALERKALMEAMLFVMRLGYMFILALFLWAVL